MLIYVENEEIELLPERALFWPAMELLLVADIGCALTDKTWIESGAAELDRLKAIFKKKPVKRVVLLGDAAPEGRSFDRPFLSKVQSWSRVLGTAFYLAFPKTPMLKAEEMTAFGVAAWADPLIIPPFAFTKEPHPHPKYFTFSGHVHPHVVLKKGGERLSFPCFQFKDRVAILPSFSEDGLSQPISWTSDERLFAIDGNEIITI